MGSTSEKYHYLWLVANSLGLPILLSLSIGSGSLEYEGRLKIKGDSERILCLHFPTGASYSLVLVMYPGWELCKFGVGDGGWTFACTFAVSISPVSSRIVSASHFC